MRLFHQLATKLRTLFARRRATTHLDAELSYHLDRQIEENRAAGMSPEEARYAALRSFGNPALLRDQTRATWSWSRLETLAFDLRYGMRTLLRAPGFTCIAIAVMALGIGANVALFTVVRGVLLKPLPYTDPSKLVNIYESNLKPGNHSHIPVPGFMPVDAGSFFDWQRSTPAMADMAALSPWQNYNVSASGGKLPEKIDAAWCSWNLFSVLGVQPALGRAFTANDDRAGAAATVILTNRFWQRRFSADPSIVGKTIWLDAKPYTVIGVLPRSFVYSGSFGGNTLDAWTTIGHEARPSLLTDYGDHEFLVIARLLNGTTLPGLLDRLAALQRQIVIQHAGPSVHNGVSGRTLLDDAVGNYKTPLYALLAATGCLLLIACMNVASLLVARTAARRRELAIRAALGGGRLRLLRERVMESLLLSTAGGVLGMLLAWAALLWLVRSRADMNRVESIHIDGTVAVFTLAIVAVCAVFSGLISAFGAGGARLLNALQENSRTQSGGSARAGLRRVLLVLEVSLTVVLLSGAGLLLKSFQHLRSTGVGVPQDNVLTMHVSLPVIRYRKDVQQVAFFEQLIARVRAIPGVEAAGLVSTAPGEGYGGDRIMSIVEHPPLPKNQALDFLVRGADPGYFAAIRLPLLRGRTFAPDERLERANVVIVSEAAARQYFPGEDPVGKHLRIEEGGPPQSWEIVGVAADTRWRIQLLPQPMLYWPIYGNDYSGTTIVVRSTRDVLPLALPVQKVIGELDPDLPVSNVMTLREAVGKSTIDTAFDSILVLAFAIIALVLAAAGLYGVLAYLVAQRTGEIGIRIALGAQREQVLRLMLADGLRPAWIGLVLGLAASAVTVRLIRTMLYETQPLDPAVFAVVAATLLVVASLACMTPAWRASRLDPMRALRTE